MLWGELHRGDGVGEGLRAGAFLRGWWGWCLGHLFVWLLLGFRLLQFCADGGEDISEGGGGGGLGCRIVPGDVVLPGFSGLRCTVMAAVASSSGVHRCGLWSRGWRVMVWRCFQLWNGRRVWRPCLVSPGGRG